MALILRFRSLLVFRHSISIGDHGEIHGCDAHLDGHNLCCATLFLRYHTIDFELLVRRDKGINPIIGNEPLLPMTTLTPRLGVPFPPI